MPHRFVLRLSALMCLVFSNFAFLYLSPSWPLRLRGNFAAHGFQSTPRVVRAVPSSGPVGGTVSVPIELVSQGDENAIGFSLTFDAAVLGGPVVMPGADATGATINTNTSQATQGRIGIALAFPANQKFSAGPRQIAVINFNISPNASFGATAINFGDQPVLREASDVNANALPLSFSSGTITITKGFEADVSPRPDGDNNGMVTVTDWVQVGRFVAGLDAPAVGNEFQRADCAPRASLGDGKISIIDWTQAGRYATSLDPITPAGGPTAPAPPSLTGDTPQGQQGVNLQGGDFRRRQSRATVIYARYVGSGQLVIELDAQGVENAMGFSLAFDPNQWHFAAAAAHDAGRATLYVNNQQAEQGIVGFAMALPASQAFRSGSRQLILCSFTPLTNSGPLPIGVSFSDSPVRREVADLNAGLVNALFTVDGWDTNLLAYASWISPRRIFHENPLILAGKSMNSGAGPAAHQAVRPRY